MIQQEPVSIQSGAFDVIVMLVLLKRMVIV